MEIPYNITARPDTGLYNSKLGIWLFLASEVMLFGALFTSYIFLRLGAEDGTWPQGLLNVPLGFLNTCILLVSSITMVLAWVALKERKFWLYQGYLAATILCGVVFLCIKAGEYSDKYHHWGFWIKSDAMVKYLPELEKQGAFYGEIPSEQVFEVRGHIHEQDATSYTILPDPKPHALLNGGQAGEEAPLTIAKADLERASNLMPNYDTFTAIYFTITGLHAMHIIGGLVVMLYFLGPGSLLYRRNPEHLSNRIEVFGIFWHFVDLVWITAFPILYLT